MQDELYYVMMKRRNLNNILQGERNDLRVMRSKADFLKRVRQGNPDLICQRVLNWEKRAKGGQIVPRKKAEIVLTFMVKDTGEVLETYKTNALSSMNNRLDHYMALYPSVEVV